MGIKIFGIGSSNVFAESVCAELGLILSPLKEVVFPDGEMRIGTDVDVTHSDVFVVHSLGGDSRQSVNDRLCELYFLLCDLRDQGARNISAIIPYLPYARSDERKSETDPVINRYVAQMLEASGVDHIITLDVHNLSAFQNAYRCPVTNLEASTLFCDYIHKEILKADDVVVLSPDIGGIKRAEKFRLLLEKLSGKTIGSAFLEKYRTPEGLSGCKLVGEVKGRRILILDDMISTGETILRALDACEMASTGMVTVFATHGVFSKNTGELFRSELLQEIVVTNSHPALKDFTHHPKLKTISCASLFSQWITKSSP